MFNGSRYIGSQKECDFWVQKIYNFYLVPKLSKFDPKVDLEFFAPKNFNNGAA